MDGASDFLSELAAYCKARGIKETTFGSIAVKDSRFVDYVRKGTVTLGTLERARAFMRDNPIQILSDEPPAARSKGAS